MKGNCFEDNFVLFAEMAMQGKKVLLCHGTPIGTGEENLGQRFWHCWVETIETEARCPKTRKLKKVPVVIFDASRNKQLSVFSRDSYYEAGSLEEKHVHRYTLDQVRAFMKQHDHLGPWELMPGVDAMSLVDGTPTVARIQ